MKCETVKTSDEQYFNDQCVPLKGTAAERISEIGPFIAYNPPFFGPFSEILLTVPLRGTHW